MSTLYLIRHGQASFGQADYDVLSPLGGEQAARLGAWFCAEKLALDAIYIGPRRRQRDTAARLAAELAGAPAPILHEGLDEYPAEVVVRQMLPTLMETDPEVRALFNGDPMGQPADARRFQRVFERVMVSWVKGHIVADGAEPFAAFAARVRRTLIDIMSREGHGRRVAVVTSAGPVAIGMQMGFELSDPMAMRTSWVVANSSVTELRWHEEVRTIMSFNSIAHLGERRLVTYR